MMVGSDSRFFGVACMVVSALLAALSSLLAAPSANASVIATMPGPLGSFDNIFVIQGEGDTRAQTFLAETDGFLGSIQLMLRSDAPGSPYALGPSIELQVRETEAGVPEGADSNLGSVTLLTSELGDLRTVQAVSFDFASLGIPVRRNETLAFVLGPETGGDLQGLFAPRGSQAGSRYPQGSAFYAEDFGEDFLRSDFDYAFRITIIPEPSTFMLLAFGLAGLAAFRADRTQGVPL